MKEKSTSASQLVDITLLSGNVKDGEIQNPFLGSDTTNIREQMKYLQNNGLNATDETIELCDVSASRKLKHQDGILSPSCSSNLHLYDQLENGEHSRMPGEPHCCVGKSMNINNFPTMCSTEVRDQIHSSSTNITQVSQKTEGSSSNPDPEDTGYDGFSMRQLYILNNSELGGSTFLEKNKERRTNFELNFSFHGSQDNLHLLSSASVEMAKQCQSDKNVVQTSVHSTVRASNDRILSDSTKKELHHDPNNRTVSPFDKAGAVVDPYSAQINPPNRCTTIEIQQLKLPHVPTEMSSVFSRTNTLSNSNCSTTNVMSTSSVAMVSMTVSDYLSSVASKRASAPVVARGDPNVPHSKQGDGPGGLQHFHLSPKYNATDKTMIPSSAHDIRTSKVSSDIQNSASSSTTGSSPTEDMQLLIQIPTKASVAPTLLLTSEVNSTSLPVTLLTSEFMVNSNEKVFKQISEVRCKKRRSAETVIDCATSSTDVQNKTKAKKKKSPLSPTAVSSTSSAVTPFGPPDPQTYKYLSDCLMRNIQLITGLSMIPQSQLETNREEGNSQVCEIDTCTDNAKSQQLGNESVNVLKKSSAKVPSQVASSNEVLPQVIEQSGQRMMFVNPAFIQSTSLQTTRLVTNQTRLPPPAHQGVGPPQQAIGEPSPAHQSSAHYSLPHPHQQTNNDPANTAEYQQMLTLQNLGMRHPMLGMPLALTDAMQHTMAVNNSHIKSSAVTINHTPNSSNNAISTSTFHCPSIVAALCQPPKEGIQPQGSFNHGQLPAKKNVTHNSADIETAQRHSKSALPTRFTIGGHSNQEALKKSIHIQNILAHLRKATPGTPLPPYMFDNKTVPFSTSATYSLSQEPLTLPHQWTTFTSTASKYAQASLKSPTSQLVTRISPGNKSDSSLSSSSSSGSHHIRATFEFENKLNQSGNTDLNSDTQIIDTSAVGCETNVLIEAQTGLLQQLPGSIDTMDDAQSVVITDGSEMTYLDEIEYEVEIRDAEHSLPPTDDMAGPVDETCEHSVSMPTFDGASRQDAAQMVYCDMVPQHSPHIHLDSQIAEMDIGLSDEVDI